MALPKIDLPTYKLFLHSLGKEITFRPFIVKEEKLLLIALESEEYDTILDTIKQVIQNCIISDGVDVNELALFEIEYLFLHLRARSMGEKVNLTYVCENVVQETQCKNEMQMEIDLLNVALEVKPRNNQIMITDNVGIKFKYPTIDASKVLNADSTELEKAIALITACTEYLYDQEQIYKIEDMQEGEFNKFLEDLTQQQFDKIKQFFDDIPKLKYSSDLTCRKCHKVHRIELEGILDFFA